MARDLTGRSVAPSNSLDSNPLSHTLNLWTSTWSPIVAVRSEHRYRHNHLDGKHHQLGGWEDEVENSRQEEEIIEGVASYGKKLGRISDVLNVLIPLVISQRDRANLKQDERRALEDFSASIKK